VLEARLSEIAHDKPSRDLAHAGRALATRKDAGRSAFAAVDEKFRRRPARRHANPETLPAPRIQVLSGRGNVIVRRSGNATGFQMGQQALGIGPWERRQKMVLPANAGADSPPPTWTRNSVSDTTEGYVVLIGSKKRVWLLDPPAIRMYSDHCHDY